MNECYIEEDPDVYCIEELPLETVRAEGSLDLPDPTVLEDW